MNTINQPQRTIAFSRRMEMGISGARQRVQASGFASSTTLLLAPQPAQPPPPCNSQAARSVDGEKHSVVALDHQTFSWRAVFTYVKLRGKPRGNESRGARACSGGCYSERFGVHRRNGTVSDLPCSRGASLLHRPRKRRRSVAKTVEVTPVNGNFQVTFSARELSHNRQPLCSRAG